MIEVLAREADQEAAASGDRRGDILRQQFTFGVAAAAADTKAKIISDWANRNLIVGIDGGGGIQGRARQLSFSGLMEVVVAVALSEILKDAPPSLTFGMAQRFTEFGTGGSGWVGDPASATPARQGAFPYHYSLGSTLMAIVGDKCRVLLSRDGSITFKDIRAFAPGSVGATVLDISAVFVRAMDRIGRDPYEILNKVYPELAS